MFFSHKFLTAKKLILPQTPNEFTQALIEWGTDSAHENSSLLFDKNILRFLKKWALNYYDESCLCVVLQDCVIIGSYVPINGKNYVVLDELLLTYPEHQLIFNRISERLSFVLGLYMAKLAEEEE